MWRKNAAQLIPLRDRLIHALTQIPHTILNGDPVRRLPGNVNVCFEGIEGESFSFSLDDKNLRLLLAPLAPRALDPSHAAGHRLYLHV